MSKFVKLAAVAVLGMAVTGASVFAADEEGRSEKHRRPERGDHGSRMKMLDKNNDQKVSLAEFKAAHVKRMNEMFKKLDRNGDGFLSREDHPGADKGEDKGECKSKGKDADKGECKGKGKGKTDGKKCPCSAGKDKDKEPVVVQ